MVHGMANMNWISFRSNMRLLSEGEIKITSSQNETEQAEIESRQSRDTIGKKNAGLWNGDVLDGTALPKKKWAYNFRVVLDHQLSLDLQLAAAMSSALHSYG